MANRVPRSESMPTETICVMGDHATRIAIGLTPEEFVASYTPQMLPLYRYFYHQIGNGPDAEDLMATTASEALAHRRRFNPARGTFAAWLFGIARHTLRDFQRQSRPSMDVARLDPPPRDTAPSIESQIVQAEDAAALHAQIRRLPIYQREAVTLRYFGALHIAEIAIVLGRSEGAVKLLIHRALTTLRNRYQREDHR